MAFGAFGSSGGQKSFQKAAERRTEKKQPLPKRPNKGRSNTKSPKPPSGDTRHRSSPTYSSPYTTGYRYNPPNTGSNYPANKTGKYQSRPTFKRPIRINEVLPPKPKPIPKLYNTHNQPIYGGRVRA